MSALACGCLRGAFIRKLALQVVEIVRLEGEGDRRIGVEFHKATVQFRQQFRGFLPVVLGSGSGGRMGGQKTV